MGIKNVRRETMLIENKHIDNNCIPYFFLFFFYRLIKINCEHFNCHTRNCHLTTYKFLNTVNLNKMSIECELDNITTHYKTNRL